MKSFNLNTFIVVCICCMKKDPTLPNSHHCILSSTEFYFQFKNKKNQINSVTSLVALKDFGTPLQELKDTTNDLIQCLPPRDIKQYGHCPGINDTQTQVHEILQFNNG